MTQVQALTELSAGDAAQLVACENIIGKGLHIFNEVGSALMRVRENRLYRNRHRTFEDYCEARWQISRRRADELIVAADVVSAIGAQTPDVPAPTNERQARELAKVPPAERAEVWRATNTATEGKPTAAAVRQERERRYAPPPTQPTPARTPAETAAFVADVADVHLGPDRTAAVLDLQRRFRVALDGVRRITEFGVDVVAEKIDDDDLRTLEMKATDLIDFYNDVASARRKPANVLFMKPKVVAS